MKHFHPAPSRPLAFATIGALVMILGADPADKDQPAGAPKPLVLFDGKSLDGWKQTDFVGSGTVKVEDGAIVMPPGRALSGITSTRKDLPRKDFELAYEAKRTSGDDFFAAATFPVGDSFITLVNGGWGGNVTGLSSLDGADASENETTRYVKYQSATWYKFRVRVTDKTIHCWVDDNEVVAINHEGRGIKTRIETRANQPLGFATWNTGGAIRNITVRALTAAEVTAADKLPE